MGLYVAAVLQVLICLVFAAGAHDRIKQGKLKETYIALSFVGLFAWSGWSVLGVLIHG